jgi:hypothetical protein
MTSVSVLKFWRVRQNHQTGKQKAQGIEVVVFIAGRAHKGYGSDAPWNHELPTAAAVTFTTQRRFCKYLAYFMSRPTAHGDRAAKGISGNGTLAVRLCRGATVWTKELLAT